MYPIALNLHGRSAVVVGGGAIAERKVRGLLAAGAVVRVIAPEISAALRTLAESGGIALAERPYAEGDCADAALVYAATDRGEVNAAVAADARRRGILVDDTSDGETSDFTTPLVHRVGSLTFAIETGGSSPSFARRLAHELAERFDERYGLAAANLRRARDYVKAVVPAAERGAVMSALASREIDALAAMNASTVEHDVEEVHAALAPAHDEAPRTSLVCATRASALAMWQTRHVGARLARAGIVSTVLQISTKGDRVQDRSLAALGTDSIFVKELELALREKQADFAVHSCKDLPSSLPEDMTLAAIGPREDPRDAFCSERFASLEELPPGALVGTSSPRRRAQLQAARPDLHFEIIRGNVDTRLRKLRDGEFDAILLAAAGLKRLGLSATYTVPLAVDVVIPAVGQGALAIETRAGDGDLAARLHAELADPATELAVRAERAFLRTLRGGCQAPVGAHATFADGTLAMNAVIAAPDGSQLVRGGFVERVATPEEGEALAEALAKKLLADGGAAILDAALGAAPEAAALDEARAAHTVSEASNADAPLAGRLFVLPRTQERASHIAPAMRGAGAEVIEVRDSDEAARLLGGRVPDVLLFPSSGSVRAVAAYLEGLREREPRPLVATMGDASDAAVVEAGLRSDIIATEPTIAAFVQDVTQFVLARTLR